MSAFSNCDSCMYQEYNEELDAYECLAYFDEDEFHRLMSAPARACPYYRPGDDYAIVRKQN